MAHTYHVRNKESSCEKAGRFFICEHIPREFFLSILLNCPISAYVVLAPLYKGDAMKIDATVWTMAGLRFLSAAIELSAAIVMLSLNDVKKAIAVNTLLAVVGPTIFLIVMMVGLVAVANELSLFKLVWIGAGVVCILIGIYVVK